MQTDSEYQQTMAKAVAALDANGPKRAFAAIKADVGNELTAIGILLEATHKTRHRGAARNSYSMLTRIACNSDDVPLVLLDAVLDDIWKAECTYIDRACNL